MIICFDPGVTTGYCIFDKSFSDEVPTFKIKTLGHLSSVRELFCFLDQYRATTNVTIIYEGFARGNSAVKEQLITIEMCGAIKALSMMCFHQEPVMQYPESRKTYVPVAKCMFKTLGYVPLENHKHALDAVAHVISYMERQGLTWNKNYWMSMAFPRVD